MCRGSESWMMKVVICLVVLTIVCANGEPRIHTTDSLPYLDHGGLRIKFEEQNATTRLSPAMKDIDMNPKMSLRILKKSKRDIEDQNSVPVSSHSDHPHLQPSSSPSKNLELKNDELKININPTLEPVLSSSVRINLKIKIKFQNSIQNNFEPIGVKVNYKPVKENDPEEIILIIRNTMGSTIGVGGATELSNDYLMENLTEDTEYVFCFSFLETAILNHSDINDTNRAADNSTSLTLDDNPIDTADSNDQIIKQNSRGNSSTITYPPTAVDNSGDLLSPKEHTVRGRKYAYTSTGKLIYLPSSAWTPSEHQFANQKKRRSAYDDSNDNNNNESSYCLKAKTLTKIQVIFSPLLISVICLSVILIFIIISIILIIFKKLASRHNSKGNDRDSGKMKEAEKIHEGNNSNRSGVKYSGNNDLPNIFRVESTSEEFENYKNNTNLLEIHQKNYHKTFVPVDKMSKSRYKKSHSALTLNLENSCEYEFHPGYEIPPSSTVEVYGYDFPKNLSSKGPWPSVSDTPTSCEFNDSLSDCVWDNFSGRVNLNKSNILNKHSEVTKCVHSFGDGVQFTNGHDVDGFINGGENGRINFKDQSRMSNSTPCIDYISVNRTLPSRRGSSCTKVNYKDYASDNEDFYSELRDYSEGERMKSSQSLGDIFITGGILVEVPEGYVYPKSNPRPIKRIGLNVGVD